MQGELTPIRGGEWRPRRHLDFYQSIDSEFVRRELLRFVAERHDGHLRLVDHIWSEIYPQSTKLDGAIFHDASEKLLLHLEQNLDARRSETSPASSECLNKWTEIHYEFYNFSLRSPKLMLSP